MLDKEPHILINREEAHLIVGIWNRDIYEYGDLSNDQKKDPRYLMAINLRKKLEEFTKRKIEE